jgi:hypothetical protein
LAAVKGTLAFVLEIPVSLYRSAFVNGAVASAVAVAALSVTAVANAEVSFSISGGDVVQYEPAPAYVAPEPAYVAPPPVYYQPAPPVYYQPQPAYPPGYYRPPPAYYAPPPPAYYQPGRDYWRGGPPPAERPRLSDMQRRALDNCAMLAPQDQRRCRATVYSTTR